MSRISFVRYERLCSVLLYSNSRRFSGKMRNNENPLDCCEWRVLVVRLGKETCISHLY